MKNNKLTLKALNQEIDKLKKSRFEASNPEIKSSYFGNMFKQSSMFYLWLITGVLSYAQKIPLIGRIVPLLGLWYGKTTWWKILVKIRKIFIIVNAAIGVLMVYKTVGFSSDNILAGFSAMGYTYIEMFANLTKRMFNWFVELFDHKIVPNVPNNKPKYIPTPFWSPRGLDWATSLNVPKLDSIPNEWVTNPFQVNINKPSTSWHIFEWKTWFYIAGTIGALYFGYKFIIDPLFISELGSPTVKAPSPVDPNLPTPDITLTDKISNNITKPLINAIVKIKSSLNPLNWIIGTTDLNSQFNNFIERQNNISTQDLRYYPFTEINPYAPWYSKIKSLIFSETAAEYKERMLIRSAAWQELSNILDKNSGGIMQSVTNSGYNTPMPGIWTPANVGIGMKSVSGSTFVDQIAATTSYSNLMEKFSSVPSTPKTLAHVFEPLSLDEINSVTPSWENVVPDPKEMARYIDKQNGYSYAKVVAKSIPSKVTPFQISKNKFSNLSEE